MKTKLFIGGAVVLSALCLSLAQEKDESAVTFKPFAESGKYVITQEMTGSGVTKADGQEFPQTMGTTMVMYMDIHPADSDGARKMEMVYKFMRVKNASGPISMSYDSSLPDDKQDPKLAVFYNVLKDARVSMVCDAKGKVTSVTGMDELFDAAAKKDAQAAAVMEQMKKQFGNKAVQSIFADNMAMFPESPVKVGQGWSKNSKMEMPILGSIEVKMDYKLDKVEDSPDGKMAVVSISGTFTGGTDKTVELGKGQMVLKKIEVKFTGSSKMDIAKGIPVETQLVQAIHSEMSLTSPDGKTSAVTSDAKQTIKTGLGVRKDGVDLDAAYKDAPVSTLPEPVMPTVSTMPTSQPATQATSQSVPATKPSDATDNSGQGQ